MMAELIDFIAKCPALSEFEGGVGVSFSDGQNNSLALKAEPSLKTLFRYANGTMLLAQTFKAEVYMDFSGDTDAQVKRHTLYEQIQQYILGQKPPVISEGQIVCILPATGGHTIKSGIGDGVLSFKFQVCYLGKELLYVQHIL